MLCRAFAQVIRDKRRRCLHFAVNLRVCGQDFELRETRRHRDRVARQRACLIHRAAGCDLLHQRARARVCTDRHAAADDLAEGHEVSAHAKVFLRAARRQAEARDDLVKDKQRAVLVAQAAQARQKALLRGHDAHVRRDRLDDDRRDLARVGLQQALNRPKVVILRHQRILRRAAGHALGVRLALGERARPRTDQHRIRVAVVAALEFDELVAPGRTARQAHRAHDRLGARVDHAHHLDVRHHFDHFLSHFDLERGRRAKGQAIYHALLHRPQDVRVAVAEHHRPPRADVVDVFRAVLIPDVAALALDHKARVAAHRAERAHGRVDAAGQHLDRPRKKLFGFRHISRCLPSGSRPRVRAHSR